MNTTQFRERIRASLANESLQIALDANAERRVKGRIAAFESLPDWKERRQRAHAVRADVIIHLDEYLEQFIEKAKESHVSVHHAKDADEAIKFVLEIAQSNTDDSLPWKAVQGSRRTPILIAKSKSMVSEEINLNHALEKEGIRVVETDLGEYIVQLRHERPAHIITPAVHLRRGDVAQLFHEKLGIPYTEDIPTLTNTARKILREVFLTADIGISGVNFGIVETGGICLVTNEGNGRMVTTMPPTHIALMGMERLVPTLDDFALMLSLLPRSATGQKLSVYTQVLHSPLNGQHRHIIILDNGRTKLRNSPLQESLYCIRCGACLNACPVFRELGGHAYGSVYPGPIGSVISPGLLGSEFVPLAQASSLCGACKEACPVDIDLPKLLTRVRAGQAPNTQNANRISPSSKLFMQIYSRVARDPRLFTVSQRLAAIGTFLLSPFSSMFRLPAFTGWGYSKDFPRFAAKPFRARWEKIHPGDPAHSTENIERNVRGNTEITELKKEPQKKLSELRLPLGLSSRGLAATTGKTGWRRGQGDSVVPKNKVEQFTEELTTLGGNVTQTKDATKSVIDFLQSREIRNIHLEPNTLDESPLHQAGITSTSTPDPEINVGVTRAICGLADTGSILIVDGEGSPTKSRRGSPLHASLLPKIHIAVLKKSTILPSLENAMDLVRESQAAVFITGPSRTADIEMTLTIGVHGPGELHVFLVDD